jgi:NADH-quinone oxidoreductase subunit N
VFEGACAEVNAFLSVASKAAALALLVRVAIGFGALPAEGVAPGARTLARMNPAASPSDHASSNSMGREIEHPVAILQVQPGSEEALQGTAPDVDPNAATNAATDAPGTTPAGDVVPEDAAAEGAAHGTTATPHGPASAANLGTGAARLQQLAPARAFIGQLVAFIAVITCTFGNLAAYGQSNIKRLLAYSTIAHAGYMMMPVSALMVMASSDARAAEGAVGALAIYIAVYLFMNLGAFAIVTFLRNAMRSEEIADYAGLIRSCPGTVVCFSAILFSLIGLPPLAGFIGKFAIFAALVDGYEVSVRAGEPAFYLIVLLVIGGLNTAISLFYYLRIVKTMTMDEPPLDRRPFVFADVSLQGVYIWLITAPTVLLILNWEGLKQWSEAAARFLLT